jgi:hypothetical protein
MTDVGERSSCRGVFGRQLSPGIGGAERSRSWVQFLKTEKKIPQRGKSKGEAPREFAPAARQSLELQPAVIRRGRRGRRRGER